MPVATEISGNIHPEIIIDIDPLTPGVLSDDSSKSASPHGLQILQQGTSGQRNKKMENSSINCVCVCIYIYMCMCKIWISELLF